MIIGFEYECLHLDRPDSAWYTVYTVRKSDLCILGNETARPHSQFLYSVNDLYIPRIGLPIWLQQNRHTDPAWEYTNRSQTHECKTWETDHDNSVLEITRPHSLFLEIHEPEPDIYNGFSFAV